MKTYMDLLRFANVYGISAIKIMIATEFSDSLEQNDIELNNSKDEDVFNNICEIIYELYLKYEDVTIETLTNSFIKVCINLRKSNDKKIKSLSDLPDLDYRKLIKENIY